MTLFARRARVLVAIAVVGLIAAGTSACSQGVRKDAVAKIRHSISMVPRHPIAGNLVVGIQPGAIGGVRANVAQLHPGVLAVADFVAEPGSRRSSIQVVSGKAPIFLDTGRSLYARRMTTSQRERRPWIRVDLKRINDTNKPTFTELLQQTNPGYIVVLSPQLMLDMLAGALTGYIKHVKDTSDGAQYEFNVSVDKANRTLRLSENARKDRKKLLRTLAITGDIFKSTALIRADGSLAEFGITFRATPDRQATLNLVAELKTFPPGGQALGRLRAPTSSETIRVNSVAEVQAAVRDQLDAAFKAFRATQAAK